jgi:hypothetical protein
VQDLSTINPKGEPDGNMVPGNAFSLLQRGRRPKQKALFQGAGTSLAVGPAKGAVVIPSKKTSDTRFHPELRLGVLLSP